MLLREPRMNPPRHASRALWSDQRESFDCYPVAAFSSGGALAHGWFGGPSHNPADRERSCISDQKGWSLDWLKSADMLARLKSMLSRLAIK